MIDYIHENEVIIRLSIFVSALIFLALWEWKWPKRVLTHKKFNRWINNILLIATGTVLVRIVTPMAAVGAAYFAEQHHYGFANHFELPAWLEAVVIFVLLDLAIYLQHAMFHVLPVFWRFHRVHHSDLDCDISTGVRFHPVEILVSIFLKIALIVMWGAPVLAVIIFEIVLNFMSMFTHSNIYLNEKLERILRWIIVTPDMHRIHHSVQENETNSNFSFHISLWDRLFGTYKAAPDAGQLGMTAGLNNFREDKWQNFGGLLMMPFATRVMGYAINYRDNKNETELAQAKELALQHKEKAQLAIELDGYLRAIGQHTLVSVTDTDGIIIEANDKFCEVSGYRLDELIGQDHRIINSGIHEKGFFRELWSVIRSGKVWRGEVCNRAKNGELYWVDSAIVPVRNLEGKIYRYISVRADITQRKKYELGIEKVNRELKTANARLEEMNQIDALTGISNRRCFDKTLANYISAMDRTNESITLVICDIDYFKNYNDLYGHQQGDACLRSVAESIQKNFTRADDLVARYGGEEFAIIIPNIDKEVAVVLVERMRADIEALALEHADSSVSEFVTISAGLTTQKIDAHTTAKGLIEKADRALYKSKNKGRNRIELSG